jgi:hypothetical protein
MKIATLTGLVLALAVQSSLAATADPGQPPVNADTKDSFAAVSGWVRKEMDTGGRYSYVSSSERTEVETKLREMSDMLDKSGSVAQMNDTDKTRMFNDQEAVNSILSKRDGERVICKNVVPIGSHIPVKTCKTMAQMEEDRKNARQFLQDKSTVSQRQSSSN